MLKTRAAAMGGPLGPRPMGQNIKGADLGLFFLIFYKKNRISDEKRRPLS